MFGTSSAKLSSFVFWPIYFEELSETMENSANYLLIDIKQEYRHLEMQIKMMYGKQKITFQRIWEITCLNDELENNKGRIQAIYVWIQMTMLVKLI